MNASTQLLSIAGLAALLIMPGIPAQASKIIQANSGIITWVSSVGQVAIDGKTYRVVRNPQNDNILKILHIGDKVDVNFNGPPGKAETTVIWITPHPIQGQ